MGLSAVRQEPDERAGTDIRDPAGARRLSGAVFLQNQKKNQKNSKKKKKKKKKKKIKKKQKKKKKIQKKKKKKKKKKKEKKKKKKNSKKKKMRAKWILAGRYGRRRRCRDRLRYGKRGMAPRPSWFDSTFPQLNGVLEAPHRIFGRVFDKVRAAAALRSRRGAGRLRAAW